MRAENTMRTLTDLNMDELHQLCSPRIKQVFSHYLHNIPSLELKSAMEYTLSNGGKLLRPLLIYAAGSAFDAPLENLDIPASAVEIIHTYSLIHDDLPCMDNADLRRGKPSCHKAFNEAIAVLTGDALQTLAIQIISDHAAPLALSKRLQMISVLCKACGPYGMAAGQALDITLMNDDQISSDLLLDIYRLKTGNLFTACLELGRLASNDDDETNQRALKEFGDNIGLAFQIQDDILDIEAATDSLGKPQGIDVANNKITYPRIHGLNAAKEKVNSLYQNALESINYLGHRAQLLREVTGRMLNRQK